MPDVIGAAGHALARYRERSGRPDATLEDLLAVLAGARRQATPPSGVATQRRDAVGYAVDGRLAFPLVAGEDGGLCAVTCIARMTKGRGAAVLSAADRRWMRDCAEEEAWPS